MEEEENQRDKEDYEPFGIESACQRRRLSHQGQHSDFSSDAPAAMSPSIHRKKLKKLRLEGIFHPKFDNETSDKDVRKEILSRVQGGEGYLEVTLKHSGSLLLW